MNVIEVIFVWKCVFLSVLFFLTNNFCRKIGKSSRIWWEMDCIFIFDAEYIFQHQVSITPERLLDGIFLSIFYIVKVHFALVMRTERLFNVCMKSIHWQYLIEFIFKIWTVWIQYFCCIHDINNTCSICNIYARTPSHKCFINARYRSTCIDAICSINQHI